MPLNSRSPRVEFVAVTRMAVDRVVGPTQLSAHHAMTYEYLCTACGHEWEASQPITAEPLKDCPKCKKAAARRQVSGGTGFVLKGGGWYADLYSSSKASSGGESSTASKEDTAAADTSTKTEAKPEKKADVKPAKKAAASDA